MGLLGSFTRRAAVCTRAHQHSSSQQSQKNRVHLLPSFMLWWSVGAIYSVVSNQSGETFSGTFQQQSLFAMCSGELHRYSAQRSANTEPNAFAFHHVVQVVNTVEAVLGTSIDRCE